jgi:hypothetical protein
MTVSRLSQLPPELINIIYEFASPYTNNKKKMMKELLFDATIILLNEKVNLLKNYLLGSDLRHNRRRNLRHVDSDGQLSRSIISEYIHHTSSKHDICDMFSNLCSCHCCKMHYNNDPKTISDTWDRQPISPIRPCNEEEFCKCKCRHYKRILTDSYDLL